jgi:hypothetical protein
LRNIENRFFELISYLGPITSNATEKASISVFNPHTFGADAEVWVATLIEILPGPARALARRMPDRFAECSSVLSPIGEKDSFEDTKHRVNDMENEVHKITA